MFSAMVLPTIGFISQAHQRAMLSVFILRNNMFDARHTQGALETTRDFHVAGVADSLFKLRLALANDLPDVLLADLRVGDGTLLGLLHELRSTVQGAMPRVLTVATGADDMLLFAALRAGAGSFIVEREATSAPARALGRLLRGEAATSASVARQALSCFGVADPATVKSPADERALDWDTDAQNPLRLSRGEQHLLVLLAQGNSIAQIAVRTAISVESIGRHIANVYRKLQWDLRSGSLALQAA
jgi:NarL family two-component system response regulator LiaR